MSSGEFELLTIKKPMNNFEGMQTDQPYYGTLRITNPRTLEMWKKTGKYQKLIDEGYIYAKGCGRFRTEVCACSKCRAS